MRPPALAVYPNGPFGVAYPGHRLTKQEYGWSKQTTTVLCAALVGAASMLFYAISPVLLGKIADQLGFNLSTLGWIAGANMLGLFLPNVTGPLWIRQVNLKRAATMSCVAAAALYLVTSILADEAAIIAVAFVFGIMTGAGYGISLAILGTLKDPDRGFAISFFFQVVAALAVTAIASSLTSSWLWVILAAAMLVASLAASMLPPKLSARSIKTTPGLAGVSTKLPLALSLAAILFVLIGESAIWTFLERIAVDRSLGSKTGQVAVAISLVAAAAGSGAAAILSTRAGRLAPMVVATLLSLISLGIFWTEAGESAFLLAAAIYGFAWNFGAAYRMGLVASIDKGGRWITQIPATQMLGAVIGPIIAGNLAHQGSFTGVYLLSGIAFAIGFALFAASLARSRAIELQQSREF